MAGKASATEIQSKYQQTKLQPCVSNSETVKRIVTVFILPLIQLYTQGKSHGKKEVSKVFLFQWHTRINLEVVWGRKPIYSLSMVLIQTHQGQCDC